MSVAYPHASRVRRRWSASRWLGWVFLTRPEKLRWVRNVQATGSSGTTKMQHPADAVNYLCTEYNVPRYYSAFSTFSAPIRDWLILAKRYISFPRDPPCVVLACRTCRCLSLFYRMLFTNHMVSGLLALRRYIFRRRGTLPKLLLNAETVGRL